MTSRPVISIDPETHKKAKIRVAELGGLTLKDAADQAFDLWLSKTSRGAKSQKSLQK